jgi:hypothetical protein
MTVHAVFEGSGRFLDPDDASKMPADGVDAGVAFATTQKRLDELVEQGIPVSKVSQSEAAKLPQATDVDAAQEA